MSFLARRAVDFLATLCLVVIVAFAVGILFVRLWSVNDPHRPTGSIMGAVNLFFLGAVVGAVIALVGRVFLGRYVARRR